MSRLLTIAILASMTMPSYAQQQRQDITTLKADARRVVGDIGGDKAKTKAYCELTDISEQLDQALEKKDRREAKELSQKARELQKKLGRDFVALVDAMKSLDPNSPDAQEVVSIIQSLDESCD